MKNKHFKSNIYYWLKDVDSITIKKRLMNRTCAICCAVYVTPVMLMMIYLYINYHRELCIEFNSDLKILFIIIFTLVSFISICFILPTISIVSVFWIPTKIVFNNTNIKYYPVSFLPFNKKIIDYSDVKDIRFIENIIISGFAGILFKNIQNILVLNTSTTSLKLIKINSKIIPEYYNQLKDEINILIKKKDI